jgi:hypothetical protein
MPLANLRHPEERSSGTRLEGRTVVFAAFVVLLIIVSVPVCSTVLPPLVDYPNHLARMHLIAEGGNEFYAVRWAPLPNLAEDLIVPALTHLMPLEIAGKLFLVITFALIAGGTLWLNRVVSGAWRWWGLLGFLLLYDRILLWGFLNYLFGLGVAICGIALWLALDDRPAARTISATAIALVCFFSHIAALGIYALAILGMEMAPALNLMRARRHRDVALRIALAGAPFVLPAILFLFCQPVSADGSTSFTPIWRKADLLFSVFDNYSRPFDVVCFALFVVLLAALAWRRALNVTSRLAAPLVILLVVYLVLPSQMASGSGVDHRLPVAIFLLLVGASAPAPPRRAAVMIGFAIAMIFVARMAVIERVWLAADRLYATDIAALDQLPVGATLAVAYPDREVNASAIPQLHVATLAVARREAFVPTLFAFPTQQPLVLRPPYDALAGTTSPNWIWDGFVAGDATERAASLLALRHYDYVVFTDRDPITVPANACLAPLPSPPRFQLFKVIVDSPC